MIIEFRGFSALMYLLMLILWPSLISKETLSKDSSDYSIAMDFK